MSKIQMPKMIAVLLLSALLGYDAQVEALEAVYAEYEETYGVELGAVDIVPENFNSARALFALIERIENE